MFFSDNELSLDLLGIFKITRNTDRRISYNNRYYDSISIRLKGSALFKSDDNSFTVNVGEILYIPQKAKYHQSTKGETLIAIHFFNNSFTKNTQIELVKNIDYNFTNSIIKEMYDVWKEKKQGYRYKCYSLFYELIYYLSCTQQNEKLAPYSHEHKINIALDYIHHNYRNTSIKVSELAEMCSISDTYFRKIFKTLYGVSPQQYIINLRLEFASHLLQSGFYSVSEVAEKSGFNDSKYFSKLFKGHFNCSPKTFQRQKTIAKK